MRLPKLSLRPRAGSSKNRRSDYSLMFCSLGNGVSVVNKNREEHGEYEKLAYISANRVVSFYKNDIPEEIRERVIRFADNDDWACVLNGRGCRCS